MAPAYAVPPVPPAEKVSSKARDILPLGFGIFLGVATPSEAAATGARGSFILVAYQCRNGDSIATVWHDPVCDERGCSA